MKSQDGAEEAAPMDAHELGVVVIGRNEGMRLRMCLLSVQQVTMRVYVDSGSTDGSQALARELGFEVVALAIPPKFTAARARNAGLARLLEIEPDLEFVQMVDGDCEVARGWISAARAQLTACPRLAVVFGRRRERDPEATIYNMICDHEWDVPLGEANSCGGDAMFRVAALLQAGGYTDSLIAGEEPDLCLRLRQSGWTIKRVAAEMTLHDVRLMRFKQWWKRAQRGGHAFAELVHRHGRSSDAAWVRQLGSIIFWATTGISGAFLLVAAALLQSGAAAGLGAALCLLFAGQIVRLIFRQHRDGMPIKQAASWAYLIMLGKIAQLGGVLQFHYNRLRGSSSGLIEYKS